VDVHHRDLGVLIGEEVLEVLDGDGILVPSGEVANKGEEGGLGWEGDGGGVFVVVGTAVVVAAVVAGFAAATIHVVVVVVVVVVVFSPATEVLKTIVTAVGVVMITIAATVVAIAPISTSLIITAGFTTIRPGLTTITTATATATATAAVTPTTTATTTTTVAARAPLQRLHHGLLGRTLVGVGRKGRSIEEIIRTGT
jgi:hypothetical protein